MTVGSLFSGIGGFDLGLERAGFRVQWQVESDPWARGILATHWPDVARHGDIRHVRDLPPVDMVCAGPPCQPISEQGHKKGRNDDRWLWDECLRVVGELRPRYVLLENPPALARRGLLDILGDLSAFGCDAEWTTIDSGALGSPQTRCRLWIVAYPHRVSLAGVQPQPCVFPPAGGEYPGDVAPDEVGAPGRAHPAGLLWPGEPDVVRVADGIPDRVDRIRGLGNAVQPQMVEWIGRRILRHAEVTR